MPVKPRRIFLGFHGTLIALAVGLGVGLIPVLGGGGGFPCVSDPNGPYTGGIGDLITLDGSGSVYATAWEWDLDNDGEFDDASGQIVTWSWGVAGTYTIGLRVTNPGYSDEASTTVTIVPSSLPTVPLMAQAALPAAIAGGAVAAFLRRRTAR